MSISTRDIAWMAGLLEGEGSFLLLRDSRAGRNPSPCVQFSTIDYDIAKRAAALFNTAPSHFQPKRPGAKPAWIVRKHGPRAIGWMLTLYGFLGERRRGQVDTVLRGYSPPRRLRRVDSLRT